MLQEKDSIISRLEVVCPPLTSKDKKKNSIYLHTLVPLLNLKLHLAPPKTLEDWIPPHGFDLAIVVSFGYFIPLLILNNFKTCLNIHPSLLPKYRGASPIQYTILNKDKVCGTSIIELHPTTFDAGRIVNQETFTLSGTEYFQELHDFLAVKSAQLLMNTIKDLDALKIKSVAQIGEVTFAKKITKERGRIDFHLDSSDDIYTRYKAFGSKVLFDSCFIYTRFQ